MWHKEAWLPRERFIMRYGGIINKFVRRAINLSAIFEPIPLVFAVFLSVQWPATNSVQFNARRKRKIHPLLVFYSPGGNKYLSIFYILSLIFNNI